jgi:phenylacetate-CoA ligase
LIDFYYVTKKHHRRWRKREFTIKQTKIDTFEIEYVSATELNLHKLKKLKSGLNCIWNLIYCLISLEKTLERSNRGKLKQFTSLIFFFDVPRLYEYLRE